MFHVERLQKKNELVLVTSVPRGTLPANLCSVWICLKKNYGRIQIMGYQEIASSIYLTLSFLFLAAALFIYWKEKRSKPFFIFGVFFSLIVGVVTGISFFIYKLPALTISLSFISLQVFLFWVELGPICVIDWPCHMRLIWATYYQILGKVGEIRSTQ